jgi:hypothetical protein
MVAWTDFLYKFGGAGVYSVKVMGQIVLRRQWNRGKTQNYEDDNQITGGRSFLAADYLSVAAPRRVPRVGNPLKIRTWWPS